MAQFDALIIFPLLWSLLFILLIHYNISIEMLIPSFFGVKKFRKKKVDLPTLYRLLKFNTKLKSYING